MNTLTFHVSFLVLAGFSAVANGELSFCERFSEFCDSDLILFFWTSAFDCTAPGTFRDPDSTDCSKYFYCDAALQKTQRDCPTGSYYWPAQNMCYVHFDCATQSVPNNDNTNPCQGFQYQSIPDKYSVDCKSYLQCSSQWVGDSQYIDVAYSSGCADNQFFQMGWGCRSDYKCTGHICQAEGYSPDTSVSDCSGFISCEKFEGLRGTGTSILFPFALKCPADTKFNPHLNKCDSYYTCSGADPHNGVDPCQNVNWQNTRAPDLVANDCKTYLDCTAQVENSITANVLLKKSCPANTFFSPTLGQCYFNHQCNQGQSCSKDPCQSGDGRYLDYESQDCNSFVECRNDDDTNQTYRPSIGKRFCPFGSVYDPSIRHCNRNYACPGPQPNYCYPLIPTTTAATTTTTTVAAGRR